MFVKHKEKCNISSPSLALALEVLVVNFKNLNNWNFGEPEKAYQTEDLYM